jgi:hypothetical protein
MTLITSPTTSSASIAAAEPSASPEPLATRVDAPPAALAADRAPVDAPPVDAPPVETRPLGAPPLDDHGDVDTLDSHVPLVTRAALDRRVRQLVPCAVQRQLWLILLDADQVQLPVMIPIGDLPLRCKSADGEGLVELLAGLDREFGVGSFVFIMERPGPGALDDTDRGWLRFLLHACDDQKASIRGVYLCHDEGPIGFDGSDLPDLAVDLRSGEGGR